MADGGYDDSNEPDSKEPDLITFDDDVDKYDEILKRMKGSREEWEKKLEDIRQKHINAQEALSETQPFLPGHSSTPYHGGEQVEMQTTLHEQTRAPPSYAETSFGGGTKIAENLEKNKTTGILDISKGVPVINEEEFLSSEFKNEQIERAKRFIRSRYPQFIEKNLIIGFSKKRPLVLVAKGPRGGETPIFLKDGSDFQQSFLNQTYVKNALGRPTQSIIEQVSADIRARKKIWNKFAKMINAIVNKKKKKKKKNLIYNGAYG